jgi:hypothetical protein
MSATTAALRTPSFAGPPPSRTQTLITSPSFTAPVSPVVPAPPAVPPPAPATSVPPPPVPAVKLPDVSSPRIAELEEEVRLLKADNEKLVSLPRSHSRPGRHTNAACRKRKRRNTESAGRKSKSLPNGSALPSSRHRARPTSRFPKNKNPMANCRTEGKRPRPHPWRRDRV